MLAVDLGVELWRSEGLLVEVHARPSAFIAGSVVRPALDTGLGLIVPF